MSPLALLLIQVLLKYGPDVAKAAHDILTKNDPTKADWDALFEKALSKTYDEYVAGAPKP
jgi:hypothetical protein